MFLLFYRHFKQNGIIKDAEQDAQVNQTKPYLPLIFSSVDPMLIYSLSDRESGSWSIIYLGLPREYGLCVHFSPN